MSLLEWKVWMGLYLVLTIRYLLIAGGAFFLFYVIYKRKWLHRHIQERFPSNKDYVREVGYSMFTSAVFATIGIILASKWMQPYSKVYSDISDYGWGYFILSIVLALIIHDTYFYWTHRLMHHPKLFKIVHLVHHKSTNPSPWAAFSFHPLEAVVEGSIIFVIAFLIPIHKFAILGFLVFMTIYNVYGHLGYEIYPSWVNKSPLAKWLNTSVNHNMHHKYFKQNYGLYFRFWDVWMGTTHNRYNSAFEEVTTRSKEKTGAS